MAELDLTRLMGEISHYHNFSLEKYPILARLVRGLPVELIPEMVLVFALEHTLKHVTKFSGRLAEVSEALDHDPSAPIDTDALVLALSKELINILAFAAELGCSAEKLAQTALDTVRMSHHNQAASE